MEQGIFRSTKSKTFSSMTQSTSLDSNILHPWLVSCISTCILTSSPTMREFSKAIIVLYSSLVFQHLGAADRSLTSITDYCTVRLASLKPHIVSHLIVVGSLECSKYTLPLMVVKPSVVFIDMRPSVFSQHLSNTHLHR